jgi:hypothetical protein
MNGVRERTGAAQAVRGAHGAAPVPEESGGVRSPGRGPWWVRAGQDWRHPSLIRRFFASSATVASATTS